MQDGADQGDPDAENRDGVLAGHRLDGGIRAAADEVEGRPVGLGRCPSNLCEGLGQRAGLKDQADRQDDVHDGEVAGGRLRLTPHQGPDALVERKARPGHEDADGGQQ